MTRRSVMILALVQSLRAGTDQQIWDLFAALAAALSAGDAVEFMRYFDPAMPDREKLRAYVAGLVDEGDLQSSVEIRSDEGTDHARSVELDWLLQIVEREDVAGLTRRREIVKCRLVKNGKNWRIAAFDPIALFAPPKAKERQ
jgi:hypothetical protein